MDGTPDLSSKGCMISKTLMADHISWHECVLLQPCTTQYCCTDSVQSKSLLRAASRNNKRGEQKRRCDIVSDSMLADPSLLCIPQLIEQHVLGSSCQAQ